MDKIEYVAVDNKLRLSIKRPSGLRRKWSEAEASFRCSKCDSTNLEAETNGAGYVLACMDCINFNQGMVERVMYYNNDEKAMITAPKYFEKVDS